MWQISFRFRQFHLCRFGRCQACDFAPQSSYWHGELLSFFDLQSLKADFATMLVLREILLQADDVVNVSRFNDDAVIRRISGEVAEILKVPSVQANVRGRDLESFVADVKAGLVKEIEPQLPNGGRVVSKPKY